MCVCMGACVVLVTLLFFSSSFCVILTNPLANEIDIAVVSETGTCVSVCSYSAILINSLSVKKNENT